MKLQNLYYYEKDIECVYVPGLENTGLVFISWICFTDVCVDNL